MPNGCRTRSVTANPPRATSGSTSPISKPSATAMLSSPRREADVSVMQGALSFAFMATLDQLSDEQRAIIELILQQGQSYDQLADSLGMPDSRVRELARDALVRLAPLTARRGRGGRGRPPGGPPPPAATQAAGRRRLLVAGGVLAVILLGLLVWPVGLLTGDDDDDGGSEQAADTSGQTGGGGGAAGIAVVAEQNGRRQVIVQAANLPPTQRGQAYEVWLYNSPQDATSLGAQVTDQRGTYQGAGALPDDYERYRFVDVSLEPIDRQRAHSGQSVLRGRVG